MVVHCLIDVGDNILVQKICKIKMVSNLTLAYFYKLSLVFYKKE